MRHTVVLISLISSALAQISATCENIAFNDDTDVLSADCVPRNQQGRVSTELDLNACFGYDGTNLTVRSGIPCIMSCIDPAMNVQIELIQLYILRPPTTAIFALAAMAAAFS
jgi:hypothetical protein